MARDLSSSPFGGANPRGWTAVLNELGYGPYKLVSVPKYKEALRVAASAMRETGRPVGLVMWKGRHAWVMSGFTSDADPRAGDDVRRHGRPRPRSAVPARQLAVGRLAQAEQPADAGEARQAVRVP